MNQVDILNAPLGINSKLRRQETDISAIIAQVIRDITVRCDAYELDNSAALARGDEKFFLGNMADYKNLRSVTIDAGRMLRRISTWDKYLRKVARI